MAKDIARNLAKIITVARHYEEDLQRTQSAREHLHGIKVQVTTGQPFLTQRREL